MKTTSPSPRPLEDFPGEDSLRPPTAPTTGIDLSLLRENLKLTPWERILANDDTVNFCDTVRGALSGLPCNDSAN